MIRGELTTGRKRTRFCTVGVGSEGRWPLHSVTKRLGSYLEKLAGRCTQALEISISAYKKGAINTSTLCHCTYPSAENGVLHYYLVCRFSRCE